MNINAKNVSTLIHLRDGGEPGCTSWIECDWPQCDCQRDTYPWTVFAVAAPDAFKVFMGKVLGQEIASKDAQRQVKQGVIAAEAVSDIDERSYLPACAL